MFTARCKLAQKKITQDVFLEGGSEQTEIFCTEGLVDTKRKGAVDLRGLNGTRRTRKGAILQSGEEI